MSKLTCHVPVLLSEEDTEAITEFQQAHRLASCDPTFAVSRGAVVRSLFRLGLREWRKARTEQKPKTTHKKQK